MNIKFIIPHKLDKIVTIGHTQTIADAVDLLNSKKIGLVIVLDAKNELFGVVSERDIIKALGDHGAAALSLPIADISTRDVVTCPGEAHPHDVLDKMFEHNIRHMPVMEGGKISSLISSRDLIKYVAKHLRPDEQAMLWAKLIQLH